VNNDWRKQQQAEDDNKYNIRCRCKIKRPGHLSVKIKMQGPVQREEYTNKNDKANIDFHFDSIELKYSYGYIIKRG
jgi:hypothetical protein